MDAGYGVLIFLVAFIALMILWVGAGISPLGILRMAFGDAASVNPSQDAAPAAMSRDDHDDRAGTAPSLQTRPQTGPDQTDDPKVRREKLLDTYRALRKLGMSRDDARALLKPWGIPLDNNLWTEAAPPPPAAITPIAQRPTSAKFHDDSELEYEPLR